MLSRTGAATAATAATTTTHFHNIYSSIDIFKSLVFKSEPHFP